MATKTVPRLMDDIPRQIKDQRWAWVLTGSGHFFDESLAIMRTLDAYDVFLSKAAEEVLRMYSHRGRVFPDTVYHTLIMAPVSSNTVAKCAYGISDNLATNVFAQAGKCRVPSIVFACDTAPELETKAPKGMVKVYPRRIDLENVAKLREFERIAVVESMADLEKAVAERQQCLSASSS